MFMIYFGSKQNFILKELYILEGNRFKMFMGYNEIIIVINSGPKLNFILNDLYILCSLFVKNSDI